MMVRLVLVLWMVGLSALSYGLPIGFGINQDRIQYSELITPNFYVYFDKRVPSEGRMALEALERARIPVEAWFKQRRTRPLPVVLSAVTDDASFANFLVDALEIQSLGQGPKSLFLHEYVHQGMYRTLDNFLGPIGNIIHLPWLPAWFIEGLADALAVTVGPEGLSGIERYQALSGDWPTYDRLHSLYTSGAFAYQGYATSAGLVRFFLKKLGPDRLAEFMKSLRSKTMPWWWPYSIVPFADSLPFDRTLQEYLKMNGKELYELYKKETKEFWSRSKGVYLLEGYDPQEEYQNGKSPIYLSDDNKMAGERSNHDPILAHLSGAMGYGENLNGTHLNSDELEFDPQSGLAVGEKTPSFTVDTPFEDPVISHKLDEFRRINATIQLPGVSLKRKGFIASYVSTHQHLVWTESDLSTTRLCSTRRFVKMPKKPKVSCPLVLNQPQSLSMMPVPLNQKNPPQNREKYTDEIYVTIKEERLSGSIYRIRLFNPATGKTRSFSDEYYVRPIDMTIRNGERWILFGERNRFTLRKVDQDLKCQSMVVLKDFVKGISVTNQNEMVASLYTSWGVIARIINKDQLKETTCDTPFPLVTPLEVAMGQQGTKEGTITLSNALEKSDHWLPHEKSLGETQGASKDDSQEISPSDSDWTKSWEKTLKAEKPLGQTEGSQPSIRDRKWRGRPVFLVPWIGAEDALGYQLGVISVPLMDHLQNETVRATILVGATSRFPYQEISFTSTRFKPTYGLTVYRQQTYNGQFQLKTTNELVTSYLDEKGVRFEVSRPTRLGEVKGSLDGGLKVAELKPYMGPSLRGRGTLIEPSMSVNMGKEVFEDIRLGVSLSGRAAPKGINKVWEYNQVGVSTNASTSFGFLSSNLSLGLEGSRTRGSAQRDYAEVYRPLKTFIPGSGGGYNQNSFPISNGGSGLFSGQYGDSQARAKMDWTFPLIKDVDYLFWIIYAERLDFTAFYNYGGAWTGPSPERGWNHLTSAHGYNLDLQMENKGVRFNLGLGTGQVVGSAFEVYLTTGFDALF
jgi:hypothetical protein